MWVFSATPHVTTAHGCSSMYLILKQAAFRLSTHYPIIDRYSVVLTTSTGAIQLWRQEECLWTREEGLSNIQEIRFVELPEKKVEDVNAVLHDEGLVARVVRHAGQTKVSIF